MTQSLCPWALEIFSSNSSLLIVSLLTSASSAASSLQPPPQLFGHITWRGACGRGYFTFQLAPILALYSSFESVTLHYISQWTLGHWESWNETAVSVYAQLTLKFAHYHRQASQEGSQEGLSSESTGWAVINWNQRTPTLQSFSPSSKPLAGVGKPHNILPSARITAHLFTTLNQMC